MRALGEIKTLDDWERFGGPVSGEHWVDGRSAKELEMKGGPSQKIDLVDLEVRVAYEL